MSKKTKKKDELLPQFSKRIKSIERAVTVDLDKLVPDPENAKLHPKNNLRAIKSSIDEFGQVEELVVQKSTMRIIAGNARYSMLKEAGEKSVVVNIVDCDDLTAKALAVTLNRTPELGEWDEKVLAKIMAEVQIADEDLADNMGFSATELKNLMDVAEDDDAEKLEASETSGEAQDIYGSSTSDSDGIDIQIYCPLTTRFDIGVGLCAYKCRYCYVKASKGAMALDAGRKVKSAASIEKKLEEAANDTRILVTGCANDPTMPEFRDALVFLLKKAKQYGVYILAQTKNPRALLEAAAKAKIPPNMLSAKVAFSMFVEDKAKILEPGAPSVRDRISAMKDMLKDGYDVMVRFHPFFCGYYDGFEEALDSLKGASRVVVEPVYLHKPGMVYFKDCEPALDETLEQYMAKWQHRDERWRYIGGMHQFNYDPILLRQEYKKLKAIANRHKMGFGICSCLFGTSNANLTDGDYCCQSPHHIKFGVKPDRRAIVCRVLDGSYKQMILSPLNKLEPGREDWSAELDRIGWFNDLRFPVLED